MAGSTASNLSSSLTGNVKKAVLTIRSAPPARSGGGGGLNASTAAALVSATLESTAIAPSPLALKRLEVQYNPASLSIQSSAEPIHFSPLLKNADTNVPTQDTRPPSISLSVQLLFDDMNVKDAFMAEKFRMSVGDVVSDAAAVVNTVREKHYSVQAQTNGLLALLMRAGTRIVTFQWADLSFTGLVSQVGAKYTMFSQSGRPIRSMVQLSLIQWIPSKEGRADWNKKFDARFLDSLSGSGGEKSATDKMGNLLNIPGF